MTSSPIAIQAVTGRTVIDILRADALPNVAGLPKVNYMQIAGSRTFR